MSWEVLSPEEKAEKIERAKEAVYHADWNYRYADDSRSYNRGMESVHRAYDLVLVLPQEEIDKIWAELRPHSTFVPRSNLSEAIMRKKVSLKEFKKIIAEEARKVLSKK